MRQIQMKAIIPVDFKQKYHQGYNFIMYTYTQTHIHTCINIYIGKENENIIYTPT